MRSYQAKPLEVERQWFLVDAKGKTVGRLAAKVASILRGKHKPTFTPNVDTGDHVVIVNKAEVFAYGLLYQLISFCSGWHRPASVVNLIITMGVIL